MRTSILVVSGGERGRGRRLPSPSRAGRNRWFSCLGGRRMQVDEQVDLHGGDGVWLQGFHPLNTGNEDQDPVQEWADEVEEGVVYGVTLRREPVHSPSEPLEAQPVFNFVQYRTHKVRRVKAATLERLVEHLLEPDKQDMDFPRVFLSTYRAFTTTCSLIQQLFKRDDTLANLDNSVCLRSPLLPLIHMWLEDYGEDLCEPPLHESLRLLISHLRHRLCFRRLARQADALLKKFQEEDHCSSSATAANHSTANTSLSSTTSPSSTSASPIHMDEGHEGEMEVGSGGGVDVTNNLDAPHHHFMEFATRDIAEQLTLLDSVLFVKVVPFHCVGCVWSQRDKKDKRHIAPTVRATIAQFNAVTNRVITSLLCHDAVLTPALNSIPSSLCLDYSSPTQRAKVIEKWIDVAQECRQLKNFSSLRAILSALQSNAIYRLKKTWAAVSRESVEAFEHMWETFPDENCVLTSREILLEDESQTADMNPQPEDNLPRSPKLCPLSKQIGPSSGIVPYLGTYLTVLTMLDTALTDTVEGGLINFEKRRREFEILFQIRQLQASCSNYRIQPQASIRSWLDGGRLLTDQQSYELSRELEPPVDPCPNSPSSWSHRLISRKKITTLLTHGDHAVKKTHADQISVSSSGSSSSEMEEFTSPHTSPLHLKLQSLSSSRQNVAEDFSASCSSSSSCSSSCPSVSPTPSSTSSLSSQPDVSPQSPDTSSSSSSSFCSSSSSLASPPPCISNHPVYNKQGADSCIVRVSVEFGNSGNVYKSILLTSQDKTAQVVQRALEKHNLEGMNAQDFSLSQLLSTDKELLIPDKANVFYAMCTSANYDFVLRQRWRSHGIVKLQGPNASPPIGSRWRNGR